MKAIPVIAVNLEDVSKTTNFDSVRAAARHIGTGDGSRYNIRIQMRAQGHAIIQGTKSSTKGEWFIKKAG